MAVIEWLQFLIGALLLLLGLGIFAVEMIGVYRFQYVLNRMHAAAMGDTLGIGFCLVGLIVMNGANLTSLKLFLVVCFLWFSSPTSSHLIARLEVTTDPEPEKHYREVPLDQLEAELKDRADCRPETERKERVDCQPEAELRVKASDLDMTYSGLSKAGEEGLSENTGFTPIAGKIENAAAESCRDFVNGDMTDTQGAEA
ncbi:MAG: monovalent cation/H(+) antiporter subunit G [Lachnospiraceae bacterium]|nr:monovalent cation/H(+) antiporter subunit G [Lachnospiraceae bacterium]